MQAKIVFPQRDATNWSYELYNIIKIIDDKMPIYRIRSIESSSLDELLEKSKFTVYLII